MQRIIVAIGFCLLGLGACHRPAVRSSGPGRAREASSAATAAQDMDFTLTLSSGGGFAGTWQGYDLASNGRVTAWSGRPGGPRSEQWTRNADPDTLAAYARELEAFRGARLDSAGNMTTRIGYVSPRGSYQWSIAGAGGAPDAPEPFRTWYPRLETYCRGLAPRP
jgi:hypothetical protein